MIMRERMHDIKRAEWHRDEVRDGIIEWRGVGHRHKTRRRFIINIYKKNFIEPDKRQNEWTPIYYELRKIRGHNNQNLAD